MENKKDIGKAFREKLDGLNRAPDNAVWESLSAELRQRKKKGRTFPFWFRTSVICIVTLVLLGTLTYPMWKDKIPHIYIDMPDKASDASTVDGGEANGNAEGVSVERKIVSGDLKSGEAEGNRVVTNEGTDPGEAVNSRSSAGETMPYTDAAGNVKSNSRGNSESAFPTSAASHTRHYTSAGSSTAGRQVTGKKERLENTGGNAGTGNGHSGKSSSVDVTAAFDAKKRAVTGTEGGPANRIDNAQKIAVSTNSGRNNDVRQNQSGISQNTLPNNSAARNGNQAQVKVGAVAEDTKDKAPQAAVFTESVITGQDEIELSATFKKKDLNGITYSADSLVISAKGNKMDISKVADSLNKLYGRDKKKEEKDIKMPKDTTPYKQFYVYGFYSVHGFEPPSSGRYLGGPTAADNSTSVEKSSGYGGYIGFNFNSRLGARVGILKSSLELSTANILLKNTYTEHPADADHPEPWIEVTLPRNFSGVQYPAEVNNDLARVVLVTDYDERAQETANVNVKTVVSFFEIPIDLTYRFKAGKFAIGAFTGISMRQLKENSVTAQNATGSLYLGKLKALEKTTFTAGLGLSLKYEVYPGLQVNAEPSMRYAFGKKQSIGPYSYMVQLGLQYNFDLFDKKK